MNGGKIESANVAAVALLGLFNYSAMPSTYDGTIKLQADPSSEQQSVMIAEGQNINKTIE
jgi:hypothetical protein